MSKIFSVIDIETSGGCPNNERIIEIAIIKTDGKKILDRFSSLVFPEKRIPTFITGLTGITNEMLENAPKFFEIAAKIVEMTKDTVFVAHNVNFDYSFVKNEFQSLGYKYSLNTLCTLSLSRRLLKGHKSYSLGKICNDLGIVINGRHRAEGDALATVELLKIIYNTDNELYNGANIIGYSIKGLNPILDLKKVDNLSQNCGVYYFYNENGELIYIGKSKNIRSRVMTHLRNEKSSKEINLRSSIADISYEECSWELIALLKESCEIKQHKPQFNKQQRRTIHNWGVFENTDSQGYINFYIDKQDCTDEPCLKAFSSKKSAVEALFRMCEEHKLCQKLCGLYQSAGACFGYGLKECNGACCGEESQHDYNKRAMALIKKFSIMYENALLVHDDKLKHQISVVQVENGKYKGYGSFFYENDVSTEELKNCIKKYPDNRDTKHIICNYLKNKKDFVVVKNH
jgi:DNA polymerase III subunit epsilon